MIDRVCNPDRLAAFAQGDLAPDAERDLISHLDECETCRQMLELEVADATAWREASRLLGNGARWGQDNCPFTVLDREHVRDGSIEQVIAQLAPSDDPHSIGRIGGYEVTGVIGSGGMGVVLKAHDRSLDRIVAVKVMAPHLATSGSARQRFAREAKAAAAVIHPNVIAIHGVSSDESSPFLVMPYIRGTSLQKRIDAEGPFPTIDVLRIGSQIAAGLAAAHEQGLVHRDIKPANILLEQGVERVTITDFGLARAVDDASMTRSGVIAGTPQYMSPEQARGETIDVRSDLFSLGSLLYAMCTGHSPFRAETSYGVLHRITHDSPRSIRELNPSIPVWLERIVMSLLSKKKEDRMQSSQQVAVMLERCIAHLQHPATIPLPRQLQHLPPSTAAALRGRGVANRWWAMVYVTAAAFGILIAGILIRIETNQGTLSIESEADDVPIRIIQEQEVVERLTVLKSGTITQLKAGEYTVEIDAPNTNFEVRNSHVSLSRGKNAIVKIGFTTETDLQLSQLSDNETDDGFAEFKRRQDHEPLAALNGMWEFQSVEVKGSVTEYQTPFDLTIEKDTWTISNSMAGGHRVDVNGNQLTFHGVTSPGTSSGLGGDVPTIAYGLYKLDGNELTFTMTSFFPVSFVEQSMPGIAPPSFHRPTGFDTTGNDCYTYRLHRSSGVRSKSKDYGEALSEVEYEVGITNSNQQTTPKNVEDTDVDPNLGHASQETQKEIESIPQTHAHDNERADEPNIGNLQEKDISQPSEQDAAPQSTEQSADSSLLQKL